MSSMISMITERVASLEASIRALEAEQAELRSQNRRLTDELDGLRTEKEELGRRAESAERESAKLREAVSESQANVARWRDAYERLRSAMQAALDSDRGPQTPVPSEVDEPGEAIAEPTLEAPAEQAGPRTSADPAAGSIEVEEPEGTGSPVRSELVASPFDRFADLRAFQEAVRSISGVRDVRLLHFDKGTLELRVEHDGVPLEEALRSLEGFAGTVSTEAGGRLVYRLQPRDAEA